MAPIAFSERRRSSRSSSYFHLALFICFIFCLIISWYAARNLRTTEEQQQQQQKSYFHFDKVSETTAAAAVARPIDDSDMVQHRLNEKKTSALDLAHKMQSSSHKHHEVPMSLRIITYNIRYATNRPVLGEHPWSIRCPKLCTQLRFITAGHESPFICLQEALYSQIIDIQTQLGPRWGHIGRGRGEGSLDGEFSPIFYRSDTWALERYETRWLSETPKKPSRGWDAALNRIVTMGEFSHKINGTKVVVMSTHFDHIGVKAREHSAELLIKFAKEWSHEGKVKPSVVLVGGDFNSTPDDHAYKVMTAPGSGMYDIGRLVPDESHYGNHLTYTSFGEPREWPQKIDFLFIQEPRGVTIMNFGVLANSFDDQVRLSDHRPVVSDLEISV